MSAVWVADCAAGARCVGYRHHRPATTRRAPLCDLCLIRAARDIWSLKIDYAELGGQLVPGSAPPGGGVSGGEVFAAAPMSLDVDALRRDIWHTIGVWEWPVRESLALPDPPAGRREGAAVRVGSALLADHVTTLAGLPPVPGHADGPASAPVDRDGVEAIAALRALHRRARRVCGAVGVVFDLPGTCNRCDATALLRVDGADRVRCGRCGAWWTWDEYQQKARLIQWAT